MIEFRKATREDCELMFRWRNDPRTRRHSFNREELAEDAHRKWFAASLENDRCILLLACAEGTAVGVLRFDLLDEPSRMAEVSIYVDPERHGQGLGKKILKGVEGWLRENTEIERLHARVMRENSASVKMFKKCGFQEKYLFMEKGLSGK
ncbi:MAG: GNAT family N-acetyltransferase [Deltaproteobacteria bacterium]|nr:GNAT family N-acetyltransferase [Deltaproteobacteria bacterium]